MLKLRLRAGEAIDIRDYNNIGLQTFESRDRGVSNGAVSRFLHRTQSKRAVDEPVCEAAVLEAASRQDNDRGGGDSVT